MLDAGITEVGQSYLVMEYIDGLPLDRFCEQRQLSLPARLDLIRKVCEAVDYAHRNLIVHLDLKPSNIFVTAAGEPKLLDFGTSKFIAADGRFTATLMATPAYASKVTAADLLAIVFSGSAGYAWRQQQRALEEGQRALRMQTFLYRLLQTANSNVTGKPAATVTEFLRLGVKVLPQYIADPRDRRQAQLDLAESMYQNRDFEAAEPVFEDVVRTSVNAGDLVAEANTYLCGIKNSQGSPNSLQLCAHAVDLATRPRIPPRKTSARGHYQRRSARRPRSGHR